MKAASISRDTSSLTSRMTWNVSLSQPLRLRRLARRTNTGLHAPVGGYRAHMARVVVIATSPVGRDELAQHIEPSDDLAVVAPAVEQSRLDWLTNDESQARARAEEVGASVADRAPADAQAVEVKPDPPSQAVVDAIAEHDPDRILVVLRSGEAATWLEDGEADRIPNEIAGVPVTLVEL